MALDPRIILGLRPLASPAEMQDDRARREIANQEIELRRQDIDLRRQALQQRGIGQPKPFDPVAAGHEMDYRTKQIVTVSNLLKRAKIDPSFYPQVRSTIGQIVPDAMSHLPPDYDDVAITGMIADGDALLAKEEKAGTPTLLEMPDPDDPTKTIRKYVIPKVGDTYPTVPKTATSAANPTAASLAVAAAGGDEQAKAALKILKAQQASGGGGAGTPLAATGGLDPDGLEYAAVKNRLTGTLPARDSKQNAAIMNAAARQIKEVGQTPVAAIQKQAAYKGDAAALAQMTKMAASAEAFESKAIAQTAIIRDLSKKVPRTKFPIINSALQAGRTEITGDANATQLANAIETFSEEYAKIMNGATGSSAAASDSSRAAAKRLINTAMSAGTMDKVLDLMQREMDLTMGGYDAVREHITTRMLGTGGAPAPAAPAAVTPTLRFNPATGKAEAIK